MLLAAVGFGIYLLGKPPAYTGRHHGPAVSVATGTPSAREAMPTGDLPGWREVFTDDFNESALNPAQWRIYSGQPGGDPAGWFARSHVKLSDGMLVISGYRDAGTGRWTTGGVATNPGLVQTYGKYLVRFRLDRGVGIGHALLLVPANGSLPPEIDFSEDNGNNRTWTLATLHYGAADHLINRRLYIDLTQWHTLGVEWSAGVVHFTVDGHVWFSIRSTGVPSVPMTLALQTQAWPCVGTWGRCPDASTPSVVHMYVDWVVAYAPSRPR